MSKARKAVAALARVRDLHQPVDVQWGRGPDRAKGETEDVRYMRKCCSHCAEEDCGVPVLWPCPTVRAIEGESV